jgi:type III restriction enzyme
MENNPILNSPYSEPRWHYATDLQGNLNYEDIRKDRRVFDPNLGGYSMPVMRQKQGSLLEVNEFAVEYGTHLINLLRQEVGRWRKAEYPDTTGTTRDLLRYWFLNPERHATRSLFFAQREAIETAIWLNEAAPKSNAGNNILNKLKEAQETTDDAPLPRICTKMATGTGKTVVMAALILYHYFNRQEYRQDTRFCDYFLLVAPGITIKDRLGVLFVDNTTHDKNKAKDYYRERDLVPPRFERLLDGLNARLVITNYHAFEPKTLQGNKRSVFDGKLGADGKKQEGKEEMTQVIKRLLKNFKKGSRLLVLNDEAHHCYLPREKEKVKTDTPADENAKEENERAAVWYTGIREIAKQFQLRAVYDLSATPYYLSGSGYPPYTLFPWIVSDFGLTDAIESGLVKIPFLPELDNTQELTPVLRDLYAHVKDELPKKGAVKQRAEAKKEGKVLGEAPPKLPMIVQTALDQFFNHYKQYEAGMRAAGERGSDMFSEPPVFIAVCNNTNVSKELYKHIAGYQYTTENGETAIMPGKCDLFNNYEEYGGLWRAKRRPPTLLIDSDALENSNQINDDFKKVFAPEIEAFKRDYRQRHPDKSVENLTDADMLREVVNTVGKRGQLGSHIRCVVSVSMLTEGWDANTVTHIMGLRAFGSQLLCEQVAGRALRRKQYVPVLYHETEVAGKPVWKPVAQKDEHKYNPEHLVLKFPPEYAHIIGVPFKLFKGGATEAPAPVDHTIVKALPERQQEHEIVFPNLIGYKYELSGETIHADFTGLQNFEVEAWKIPLRTILGSAFTGDKAEMQVKDALEHREQEIFYTLTRNLIRLYFNDAETGKQFHLFGQLKNIVADWYRDKVVVRGDTDEQWKKLVLLQDEKTVCDHLYEGIRQGRRNRGEERVLPVFNHYNPFGSTKYIHGLTTKPCYDTVKSHVNVVVADTASANPDANFWEHIAAKTLEELPEVQSYFKNAYSDFQIPYVADGKDRHYKPDFICRCPTQDGRTIMLILEITGANKQYKTEKKLYTETYWIPAVNAVAGLYPELGGAEWRFLEVSGDVRDVKQLINYHINV